MRRYRFKIVAKMVDGHVQNIPQNKQVVQFHLGGN